MIRSSFRRVGRSVLFPSLPFRLWTGVYALQRHLRDLDVTGLTGNLRSRSGVFALAFFLKLDSYERPSTRLAPPLLPTLGHEAPTTLPPPYCPSHGHLLGFFR